MLNRNTLGDALGEIDVIDVPPQSGIGGIGPISASSGILLRFLNSADVLTLRDPVPRLTHGYRDLI